MRHTHNVIGDGHFRIRKCPGAYQQKSEDYSSSTTTNGTYFGRDSVAAFLSRFFIAWEIKYLKPVKYLAS
jgi:hypothetical protein